MGLALNYQILAISINCGKTPSHSWTVWPSLVIFEGTIIGLYNCVVVISSGPITRPTGISRTSSRSVQSPKELGELFGSYS